MAVPADELRASPPEAAESVTEPVAEPVVEPAAPVEVISRFCSA